MKEKVLLLLVLIVLLACKQEVVTYKEFHAEELKETIDEKEFIEQNKNKILNKIKIFKKLRDTLTVFGDELIDSSFYFQSKPMKAINFSKNDSYTKYFNDSTKEKIVFIPKHYNDAANDLIMESYANLYYLEKDKSYDFGRTDLNDIKDFLEVKIAFVVTANYYSPEMMNSETFNSGFFAVSIVAYDLEKDIPLVKFYTYASNSNRIKYEYEYNIKKSDKKDIAIDAITSDFKQNIRTAIFEACNKHFKFSN